jgi:hypothetical protein
LLGLFRQSGLDCGGGDWDGTLYPLCEGLTRAGKKVTVMLGARSCQDILAEDKFFILGMPGNDCYQ